MAHSKADLITMNGRSRSDPAAGFHPGPFLLFGLTFLLVASGAWITSANGASRIAVFHFSLFAGVVAAAAGFLIFRKSETPQTRAMTYGALLLAGIFALFGLYSETALMSVLHAWFGHLLLAAMAVTAVARNDDAEPRSAADAEEIQACRPVARR